MKDQDRKKYSDEIEQISDLVGRVLRETDDDLLPSIEDCEFVNYPSLKEGACP